MGYQNLETVIIGNIALMIPTMIQFCTFFSKIHPVNLYCSDILTGEVWPINDENSSIDHNIGFYQ